VPYFLKAAVDDVSANHRARILTPYAVLLAGNGAAWSMALSDQLNQRRSLDGPLAGRACGAS
jgi:hypothetical protein